MGPVAAEVAIKQLGTNGGGFFGPNSAHPFENPSPWSNLLEVISIIIIPMASIVMFGRMIKDRAHAAVIFGVMMALLAGRRGRGHPCRAPAERRHGRPARPDGRQPRGEGSAPGAGPLGDLGGDHDRHVERLGQLRCTTASSRWAAWFPCR